MDVEAGFTELLKLADQLAIEVRFVALDGGEGGGFCRLKDKKLLLVDSQADTVSRYQTVLGALAQQDGLDQIYILPSLREELDRARPDQGTF